MCVYVISLYLSHDRYKRARAFTEHGLNTLSFQHSDADKPICRTYTAIQSTYITVVFLFISSFSCSISIGFSDTIYGTMWVCVYISLFLSLIINEWCFLLSFFLFSNRFMPWKGHCLIGISLYANTVSSCFFLVRHVCMLMISFFFFFIYFFVFKREETVITHGFAVIGCLPFFSSVCCFQFIRFGLGGKCAIFCTANRLNQRRL